jgi:acetoin:2,6-dichlorophenolindophenol oxidoreductase subunit beta
MSIKIRKINYALAINEALIQSMECDDSVFVIGQGLKSPWYVGQTCSDLIEKFSERRVIDTPVSENGVTGIAVGAAIAGMRPVCVHPRMDFMCYAFDPIINQAANWNFMSGGKAPVPAVIWGIINRGGEQAAQHSQSFHATFAHIPGLKVVMPSTPYDAKGLMTASIKDENPVVFIDDRWLYGETEEVPESYYEVEIGSAAIRQSGSDLTVVGSSFVIHEALKAAKSLTGKNYSIEVIDLRTIKPLDEDAIINSVNKTGRLLVVDGGWKSFGVSAEIIAMVAENSFSALKSKPQRLTLPDAPAAASRVLEYNYYVTQEKIEQKIKEILD